MKDRFPNDDARKPFGPALGWYRVTPATGTLLPARPVYLRVDVAGVLRLQTVRDINASPLVVDSDETINVVAGEVIDARPHIIHADTTATVTAFW